MQKKIEPLSFIELKKMPIDQQREYIQTLVECYKAVKLNITEMLDVSNYDFDRYAKKAGLKITWPHGHYSYDKCAKSASWDAFIDPVRKTVDRRRGANVRYDCFAYEPSRGRKRERCAGLNRLYCKTDKCAFYKTKAALTMEYIRLYGNAEGLTQYPRREIIEGEEESYR